MKKKTIIKIFLGLVLVLIVVAMIILGIKMIKKNNIKDDIKVYALNGESEKFSYTDGLFINSSIQNIFSYGVFKIKDDNLKEEDILGIDFKVDDDFISGQSSAPKGTLIESTKYKELFKKDDYENSNFSITVTYFLDNKAYTETINLEKERLLDKNNISESDGSIGVDDSSDSTDARELYRKQAAKVQTLLNKGFTYNGRYHFERTFDDGSRISLRTDGTNFVYYNKKNNYQVETFMINNIHSYSDGEVSFTYNANTNDITCQSKKCPSDAYEDIKDYLELYNSLWD